MGSINYIWFASCKCGNPNGVSSIFYLYKTPYFFFFSGSRVPQPHHLHLRIDRQRPQHRRSNTKGNENAHQFNSNGFGHSRPPRHGRVHSLQLLLLHTAEEVHVQFGRLHTFPRQLQSSLSHHLDLADCDSRRVEEHRHRTSPGEQGLVHEPKHHSCHRRDIRHLSGHMHSPVPGVHVEDVHVQERDDIPRGSGHESIDEGHQLLDLWICY